MLKKTFSLISLGCFRNTYDSQKVIERFLSKGYTFKNDPKECSLLIVNTCGFINEAKKESLEVIKEAVKLKEKGKIKELLVFGCLVERYLKELKKFFPEVNRWWGVEKITSPPVEKNYLLPSHIGFLKISEGCSHNCSYCAIPLIKGQLKSKKLRDLIREAKILEREGVKELNIIGQDITSWAKDLGLKDGLTLLIKEILKETNIKWIRLIYTHPLNITPSLIDLIASEERICKYIDLPIQHINSRILRMMNRKTTKEEIISLIRRIREKVPEVFLRTSIIVGFPTEGEKEFKELLKFIKDIKFERLGVFIYSREEGTSASKLSGQIHPSTKKSRYRQIMEVQQSISREVNKKFLNKEIEVLIDKHQQTFIGRTQYDTYDVDGIVFVKRDNLKVGNFYKVKIIDSLEYDLVGYPTSPSD